VSTTRSLAAATHGRGDCFEETSRVSNPHSSNGARHTPHSLCGTGSGRRDAAPPCAVCLGLSAERCETNVS